MRSIDQSHVPRNQVVTITIHLVISRPGAHNVLETALKNILANEGSDGGTIGCRCRDFCSEL